MYIDKYLEYSTYATTHFAEVNTLKSSRIDPLHMCVPFTLNDTWYLNFPIGASITSLMSIRASSFIIEGDGTPY